MFVSYLIYLKHVVYIILFLYADKEYLKLSDVVYIILFLYADKEYPKLSDMSNFVIGLYFLSMVNIFGISAVYLGFSSVCILAVLYILGNVVETKGRSLEGKRFCCLGNLCQLIQIARIGFSYYLSFGLASTCLLDRMAHWCRKCIYLKPKLEKLAAEYYPRVRFYCIDVNSVPQSLVNRAGVIKMPTIQLWHERKMQGEVIGGHTAWLVIEDIRRMIDNEEI